MVINKEAKLFINLLKNIGLFSIVDENNRLLYKTQKKEDFLVDVEDKSKELNISNKGISNINQYSNMINKTDKDNKTDNMFSDVITNSSSKVFTDIKSMKTLHEVKEYLNNFKDFSLAKTAINTVFGIGNHEAELLVIGEAPGAEEDKIGKPFVGRSGQLLTQALYSIGIHREKIFITNTIFWRPPGNRNPTSIEVDLCRPFIYKIISLIKPKMILIVGKVAATTLLEEEVPLSAMLGKWFTKDWGYPNEIVSNIQVRVVYHPAYLLRNPIQKKVFWFDLIEIFNKISELKLNV